MAFDTNNIGKSCYINISKDENVENSVYGTIIGLYNDSENNEEYYLISIDGYVEKIYDDSLINIIDDGGSGGGANVLTLYSNNISTGNKAYKNPECTEQYTSYNEAFNAILNADKIQIVDKKQNGISDYYDVYTAVERISAYMSEYASNVTVVIDGTNGIQHINLWNMEED